VDPLVTLAVKVTTLPAPTEETAFTPELTTRVVVVAPGDCARISPVVPPAMNTKSAKGAYQHPVVDALRSAETAEKLRSKLQYRLIERTMAGHPINAPIDHGKGAKSAVTAG